MVKSDSEIINNSVNYQNSNEFNKNGDFFENKDEEELKGFFFQELIKELCLDNTRKNFAEDTFITLFDMVSGIKERFKHNGFRRLLLGRKGVGKTRLLKCMQNISKNIFNNLLTIYCDLNNKVVLPSILIAKALFIKNVKDIEIEDLEEELKKQNKYIFLVYDELQSVYSGPPSEDCKQIINELSYIGGSLEGRIHCIITGSSCDLRRLCFGKLKEEENVKFPNYTNKDLNSTKFSARWIFPFLDKNDFMEYVTRCLPKKGSADNQEFLVKMYLETSGNPRLMSEFNSHNSCDSYTYTLKNIDQENLNILRAIFQIVKDLEELESIQKDLSVDIDLFEKWTLLFRVEWLNEKLGYNVPITTIYDLADNGYIRYLDKEKKIGIGSPTIYLELSQRVNDKSKTNLLSHGNIMALKYPFGNLKDIAEKLALQYLARSSEKWLNFKLVDDEIKDLDINKTIKQDEIKYVYLRMHKEIYDKRDALGADGLVINLDNEKRIVFHRIQIKLGSKYFVLKDAEEVIQKFKLNEKKFVNTMNIQIECNKDNICYYLVTTRFINEEAEKILQNHNIKILNSDYLAENIWPEEVKYLGKPYSSKKKL